MKESYAQRKPYLNRTTTCKKRFVKKKNRKKILKGDLKGICEKEKATFLIIMAVLMKAVLDHMIHQFL